MKDDQKKQQDIDRQEEKAMNEVSKEFTHLASLIGANTVESEDSKKDNFKLNIFPN